MAEAAEVAGVITVLCRDAKRSGVACLCLIVCVAAVVEGVGLPADAVWGKLSEVESRARSWTPNNAGRYENAAMNAVVFHLSGTLAGLWIWMARSRRIPPPALRDAAQVAGELCDRVWREVAGAIAIMGALGSFSVMSAFAYWGVAEYSEFFPVAGLVSPTACVIVCSAQFNAFLAGLTRLGSGPRAPVRAARLVFVATLCAYVPFAVPASGAALGLLRKAAPRLDVAIGALAVLPACARAFRRMRRQGRWSVPAFARHFDRRVCRRRRPELRKLHSDASGSEVGSSTLRPLPHESGASTGAGQLALLDRLDNACIAGWLVYQCIQISLSVLVPRAWEVAGVTYVVAALRGFMVPPILMAFVGTVFDAHYNEVLAAIARVAVEEKIQHQRTFLRYLFHEIRVPLSTISLVVDEEMPLSADAKDTEDAHDEDDTTHDTGILRAPGAAAARAGSSRDVTQQDWGSLPLEGSPAAPHAASELVDNPGHSFLVRRDAAHALRSALTGVMHLLNDVLTLEKIESGHFSLERAPCNVERMVREVTGVFRAACGAKRIELKVAMDWTGPRYVDLDEHRVRQVLSNFLSNAVKFTAPGGSVTLTVEQRAAKLADELEFRVSDSGVGFEPEEADRLFKPFSQIRAGISQAGGGSGLGLSICRTIVELHGGRIGGASAGSGRGSSFWFSVPVPHDAPSPQSGQHAPHESSRTEPVQVQPRSQVSRRPWSLPNAPTPCRASETPSLGRRPAPIMIPVPKAANGMRGSFDCHGGAGRRECATTRAHVAPSSASTHPAPSQTPVGSVNASAHELSGTPGSAGSRPLEGLRVVVVDDSSALRKLMASLVMRLGAGEVRAAGSALEALHLVQNTHAADGVHWVDVIITDVLMPQVTGIELAERLRRSGFPGIIIAATGQAMADDRRSMAAAGIDEVAQKPVSRASLSAAIESARAKRLLRVTEVHQLVQSDEDLDGQGVVHSSKLATPGTASTRSISLTGPKSAWTSGGHEH